MLLVKLGISAAIPDVPHHVAVQVALCTAVLMRMCFCNCLYVFCLHVRVVLLCLCEMFKLIER